MTRIPKAFHSFLTWGWQTILTSRLALIGQAFAALSIFVPIFFGPVTSLGNIVAVAAIGAILTPIISLGIQVQLPRSLGQDVPRNVLSAQISSISFSLIFSVFAIFVTQISTTWGYICLASAALCFCQSFYVIEISRLVRLGHAKRISLARFANSFASLLLVLINALSGGSWLGYSLAGSLGFIAPMFLINRRAFLRENAFEVPARRTASETIRGVFKDGIKAFEASSAATVSAICSQVPYLIVGSLGSLSIPWSIGGRIASGFETLLGNVFGPILDVMRGKAVRSGESQLVREAIGRTLTFAVALSSFGAIITAAFVALLDSESSEDLPIWMAILCVALLTFSQTLFAGTGLFMQLLGLNKSKIVLDVVRTVTLVASAFMFTGLAKCIALEVALLLSIFGNLGMFLRLTFKINHIKPTFGRFR
jgi:hypothetical protein